MENPGHQEPVTDSALADMPDECRLDYKAMEGRITPRQVTEVLLPAVENEHESATRASAAMSLAADTGFDEALPVLHTGINMDDEVVRLNAQYMLGKWMARRPDGWEPSDEQYLMIADILRSTEHVTRAELGDSFLLAALLRQDEAPDNELDERVTPRQLKEVLAPLVTSGSEEEGGKAICLAGVTALDESLDVFHAGAQHPSEDTQWNARFYLERWLQLQKDRTFTAEQADMITHIRAQTPDFNENPDSLDNG